MVQLKSGVAVKRQQASFASQHMFGTSCKTDGCNKNLAGVCYIAKLGTKSGQ